MAYTAPGTAVAGDVLTAAFWNQQVRDNMEAVAGPPLARNILYNGAMQVAQRSSSVASITAAGYYTADRWNLDISSLGTWTQSVDNDAPTGSGLRKSLKMLCTTADASPAAGDYCIIQQRLEGQDLQRIAKGTSSAQPLAVSFWTKSSTTGTYNCYLQDLDNSRSISAQYTISASGTWEYKTVYFPADTTGAFDNDNAVSLYLVFVLGAGSSWTSGTTPTSWQTVTLANLAPGQTNLAAASSNYWQVTGVQLETGSVATGFEFLPYGDELARCQRYYFRESGTTNQNYGYGMTNNGASTFMFTLHLPVTMRAVPNVLEVANVYAHNVSNSYTLATFTLSRAGTTAIGIGATPTGMSSFQPAFCAANGSSSFIGVGAEL
jgi:hypothetical protein